MLKEKVTKGKNWAKENEEKLILWCGIFVTGYILGQKSILNNLSPRY